MSAELFHSELLGSYSAYSPSSTWSGTELLSRQIRDHEQDIHAFFACQMPLRAKILQSLHFPSMSARFDMVCQLKHPPRDDQPCDEIGSEVSCMLYKERCFNLHFMDHRVVTGLSRVFRPPESLVWRLLSIELLQDA